MKIIKIRTAKIFFGFSDNYLLKFSMLMLSGLILFSAVAQTVHAASPQVNREVGQTSDSQRFVTIDFNDVDISLFIKYISELTGKNFIVDRSVRGKITVISPTSISVDDAYRVFESVLEVHGFTTVPSGSVIKIIPAVQARFRAIATIRDQEINFPNDKIVTQIIEMTHVSPDMVKKILTPLVSKTSVLISHSDSGMLIITDVLSNINRLMEIIRAIDVPSIGEELAVLPLTYASATTVAKSVSQVFQQVAQKGVRRSIVRITPYERSNSLIVFAPKAHIRQIRELVAKLDTPVARGGGNIHVYYLQNGNAEDMVKVLANLPEKQAAGAKGGPPLAPSISDNVRIMADPAINALIITGPYEEYLVLEEVIRKLDIPRRMVYLEALIMEVSADKKFEFGVEWGGVGEFAGGDGRTGIGFGGNPTNPYSTLLGIGATPPTMPGGFTLGVMRKGISIGNVVFPDLGAVMKAYSDDSDVNIVANPQILTMDNNTASIIVGENVPFIVSKHTTEANQDYTSYEYKDVATTLEITPQVNNANVLRLEIMAELIKLKNPNDPTGTPTTFKRRAETTVVVHNNDTVVIGGITGQQNAVGQYKVPILGDIPVLGWLFKTETTYEKKTNLYIFITPRIVENPAELAAIYHEKRDIMDDITVGPSGIDDWKLKKEPDPSHAAELIDLGFVRMEAGGYEEARQYFEEALKIEPDNPYALINLGVACKRLGRQDEAAQHFRRVSEFNGRGQGEGTGGEFLRETAKENLRLLEAVPGKEGDGR